MVIMASIKEGKPYVSAPQGEVMASLIGIEARALQKCFGRLRAERVSPTMGYPIQVNLWLRPPPADDLVSHPSVVWVSIQGNIPPAQAAAQGLLSASTPAQAQHARRAPRRQLSSIGEAAHRSLAKPLPSMQLTIGRRCSRALTFRSTPPPCECRFEMKRAQEQPRPVKRERRSVSERANLIPGNKGQSRDPSW